MWMRREQIKCKRLFLRRIFLENNFILAARIHGDSYGKRGIGETLKCVA